MMIKRHILLIAILFIGISSCTELGPKIVLTETDRVVLIEEFTGARCVNCPEGSSKIEDLKAIHGDKLIAVSIHGGIFADPYPHSNYDFRTDDGNNLLPYLNAPNPGPVGYPAAVINRTKFPGEQERQVFLNDWAGYISSELQQAPLVRVDLTKNYDPTTRVLTVDTDLFFFEEVTGNSNITVLITEDNIVDVQASLSGEISDYKHKHVLRDVISTNYRGDVVGTNVGANTNHTFNFTYTIPDGWKTENCHVVAFVNRNDGGTLDVLQAAEVSVE